MNPFFIDLLLCLLTYLILLWIILRGSRWRRSFNQTNEDGEGGLLFDYEKGPTLDLPPGVDWPSGPIKNNKKQKKLA